MDRFEHSEVDNTAEVTSAAASRFPVDFSVEEAVFSATLQELFPAEREELPPLYIQTLAGEPNQRPVETSFEQKITYQVFRRLRLPRRPLFVPEPAAALSISPWRPLRSLGRVGAALGTCVIAFMILSVALSGPSFAEGLRILLGQTGVAQVHSYPTGVRSSAGTVTRPDHQDPQAPPSSIYWFGDSVAGYTYQSLLLNQQEWSQGPIVELEYALAGNAQGRGLLDVREFRLAPEWASVLQVVGEGSVTPVTVLGQPGVYVDGCWTRYGRYHLWQSGTKSEVIFELNGLILWIAADQRDGMDLKGLVAAAQRLVPISLQTLWPVPPSLQVIGDQLQNSLESPITGEVLALIPAGSSLQNGPAAFVSVTGSLSGSGPS